jgi:hypothetical protein
MANADDAELADDLVGVSSARLLAAGIPRDERMAALRLLGILATVADRDHRVRRPLGDVAREFELSPVDVDLWADHLESIGALERDGQNVVLAGAEPAYTGALRLHDFLDLAAGGDASRGRRPARQLVRPRSGILVAAALLLALLVAPRVLDQQATPVSANVDAPVATTGPPLTTSGRPGIRPGETSASTTPTSGATPTTKAAPSIGPSGAPTTTLLPPVPACPSGAPIIEVLGASNDLAGSLTVSGVVRNPTAAALSVKGFTVRATVLGQTFSAPGTAQPLAIAAGGTAVWHATLPVAAPPTTPVQTALGAWSWNDPSLPTGCPTP